MYDLICKAFLPNSLYIYCGFYAILWSSNKKTELNKGQLRGLVKFSADGSYFLNPPLIFAHRQSTGILNFSYFTFAPYGFEFLTSGRKSYKKHGRNPTNC